MVLLRSDQTSYEKTGTSGNRNGGAFKTPLSLTTLKHANQSFPAYSWHRGASIYDVVAGEITRLEDPNFLHCCSVGHQVVLVLLLHACRVRVALPCPAE
jgi:hypothetical protein